MTRQDLKVHPGSLALCISMDHHIVILDGMRLQESCMTVTVIVFVSTQN